MKKILLLIGWVSGIQGITAMEGARGLTSPCEVTTTYHAQATLRDSQLLDILNPNGSVRLQILFKNGGATIFFGNPYNPQSSNALTPADLEITPHNSRPPNVLNSNDSQPNLYGRRKSLERWK